MLNNHYYVSAVCANDSCLNGGTCQPVDFFNDITEGRFICLCPHDYWGDFCESGELRNIYYCIYLGGGVDFFKSKNKSSAHEPVNQYVKKIVNNTMFNPFRPEFTIVIHYKPRIAAAILDL